MRLGPHPQPPHALRATAFGLAARFAGSLAISAIYLRHSAFRVQRSALIFNALGAPPPTASRASRDGLWPCRPLRGQPGDLCDLPSAFSVPRSAFSVDLQCAWAPPPNRLTRFARRPLALPPASRAAWRSLRSTFGIQRSAFSVQR